MVSYGDEKRMDMELCQKDKTPSLKQTNQEHTFSRHHMVFNEVGNPQLVVHISCSIEHGNTQFDIHVHV